MPTRSHVIRRLLRSERGRVRDHLLRLDPEDRRLRFLGSVGDSYIETYSKKLFATGDIMLGCFIDGELRPVAEVAITVERPFQNNGIGTTLLRQLVEFAQNRRIRTLHLFCLLDNHRMQSVARKLGGELSIVDGEVEVDINPSWPTCWSLIDEALAEGQAALHAWWGDRHERGAPRPVDG
jgi:RimJ/RimL family protein N-acetyltransferase